MYVHVYQSLAVQCILLGNLFCLTGVMASIRGHPFWVTVMNLMLARGPIANNRSILGFKNLSTILKSTGELLLTATCKNFALAMIRQRSQHTQF